MTRLDLAARQTADYLERKRAEEREDTLRRELEHRSNNLFAVIQSIVRRTLSTSDTLENASNALEGRMQALARANRKLAEAGWRKIDLAEIARGELSILPGRTNFEGGSIDLDPQTGQKFALLMHELMTNAIKHGALSGAIGRVTVFWRLKHDGAEPVLSFRWEERDGPPVSEPKRQGFGSHLLGTIFTESRVENAAHAATDESGSESMFAPWRTRGSVNLGAWATLHLRQMLEKLADLDRKQAFGPDMRAFPVL